MLVPETRMYPLKVPGVGIFISGYQQKPYSNKKIEVLELRFLNTHDAEFPLPSRLKIII
jgi:hypothetical protein